MTASIIGFDVPDVGATLDRLAAVMDRHIGDVALTGADGAVGENVINLTLEAVGGTHSVEGVSDEVLLGLEMADPELVPISRTLYDNTGANTVNWDGVSDTWGSGAYLETSYNDPTLSDPTYGELIRVNSGDGWGTQNGFAVFANWGVPAGYDAYDTFNVKIKGLPSDQLEVVLCDRRWSPDSVAVVSTADTTVSTDLGDGWYAVSIPFSAFSNNDPAVLANHSGWKIGHPGDNGTQAFDFYLTDASFGGRGPAATAYVDGLSARDFLEHWPEPGVT